MSAASIARQIGASRQGHNWRAACPCGCGYTLSFCEGENGQLIVHCFGGCDHSEILAELVQFGLLDGDDGDDLHVSPPVAVCQRDATQRIADARRIYSGGVWDERIGVYLRSRGIRLISPVLRFTEHAPNRFGARLPAMLAPVVDLNGALTGVHMTFLKPDGMGKANLGHRDFQRECRGVIHGGAIRLAEHDPDTELVTGEGVETVASAMQLFGLAGWAAISADGLKAMELPPHVGRVLIAADNDVSRTGQRVALAAYDRWTAEGRSVRIKCPPAIGTDFNDFLFDARV